MALTKITGEGIGTTSGNLTVDVAGDIILDADGGDITIKDGGTTVGNIGNDSTDLYIAGTTHGLKFDAIDASTMYIRPVNNSGSNVTGQIDLGQSGNVFRDAYVSGGVYFAPHSYPANYLDDYEEGTWTPTYTGASGNPTVGYSQQVGSYVKVGKFVFLSFSINTSSVSGGSSSSDLRVSGLPFTCGSQSGDRGALSTVRTQNWVSNARSPVGGYINANTNYINLNSYDSGAYATATLCDTDDLRTTGDSNQLTATVTYITS